MKKILKKKIKKSYKAILYFSNETIDDYEYRGTMILDGGTITCYDKC